MIRINNKALEKSILEFLRTRDGTYYGNLAMELNSDPLTILEHLISLKKQGLVYKDNNGGKFKLKSVSG